MKPSKEPPECSPVSRPGSSNIRDSTGSLTSGEKDIIRGICQNKFYGDGHNWTKTGSSSVLASRRSTPEVPAPERKTFRDVLPQVHVTPIVPRLWPDDDFTAGILKIVREVQVRHLARNVCSGMSVPQFDLRGLSKPPCLEKASLPVTNLTLPQPINDCSKRLSTIPTWPNYPQIKKQRKETTLPPSPAVKTKKNTPASATRSPQTSPRVPPRLLCRNGMTKTRRVIEVSGKDGGQLKRKLYLDVFLPTAGMVGEDEEEHKEEEEEGKGSDGGDGNEENGQENIVVNIDRDEVEYID